MISLCSFVAWKYFFSITHGSSKLTIPSHVVLIPVWPTQWSTPSSPEGRHLSSQTDQFRYLQIKSFMALVMSVPSGFMLELACLCKCRLWYWLKLFVKMRSWRIYVFIMHSFVSIFTLLHCRAGRRKSYKALLEVWHAVPLFSKWFVDRGQPCLSNLGGHVLLSC